MGRPGRAGLVAASVAVVAAVAAVVWTTQDDRERLAAGEQVDVDATVDLAGFTTDVLLPSGEVRVKVTEPADELPAPCCRSDAEADVRPPAGGRVVGLEVRPGSPILDGPTRNVPFVNETELPQPVWTLVVDRGYEDLDAQEPDRYEVEAPPAPGELRTWVAVDGQPSAADLSLEVAFDGVVQVVDVVGERVDPGDAEGLGAASDGPTLVGCGRARTEAGFSVGDTTCSVALWTTPYLPGVGWSEQDAWVIASTSRPVVSGLRRTVDGEPFRYEADTLGEPEVPRTLRLDGERPDQVVSEGSVAEPTVVAWQVSDPVGARLVSSVDLPVESLTDPSAVRTLRVTWARGLPVLP